MGISTHVLALKSISIVAEKTSYVKPLSSPLLASGNYLWRQLVV